MIYRYTTIPSPAVDPPAGNSEDKLEPWPQWEAKDGAFYVPAKIYWVL